MKLWWMAALVAVLAAGPALGPLIFRRRDAAKRGAPAGPWRLRLVLAAAVAVAAAGAYLALGALQPPRGGVDRLSAAQLVARLEQVLAERPEDVRGWTLLGNARMALGRFAAAADAYRTALAAGGDEVLIGPRLAEAERRVAAVGGMVQRLEARTAASPEDIQAWLELARARAALKRREEAQAALNRAQALATGDAAAMLQVRNFAAALDLSLSAESGAAAPSRGPNGAGDGGGG